MWWCVFFFNDTATTEIYTLSLHDALPISGDGAVRYGEEVARWIGTAPVPPESLPPAATLLLALLEREGSGRTIGDPATAEPVYGRPAEAQARWEARHGRPLPDSPRPAG